ncbi:hypothetical protein [Reichenbachiella ulvae]|uniref:DUF423 domain-containing protein n=1 Tax=Reichenbachiella ulvae TaxID=2980104 RepID=A0ABT3CRU8_9BACT|nr:hypothetical protein [Reichenbachiella ulvae]MCV9386436.1 hypothetical protein [Reichenbachiella ulvae]
MSYSAAISTLEYLNKAASKKSKKNKNGWYELRMHRLYQILGIGTGIMGFSFMGLLSGGNEINSVIIILMVSIGFVGLGLALVLWFKNQIPLGWFISIPPILKLVWKI